MPELLAPTMEERAGARDAARAAMAEALDSALDLRLTAALEVARVLILCDAIGRRIAREPLAGLLPAPEAE